MYGCVVCINRTHSSAHTRTNNSHTQTYRTPGNSGGANFGRPRPLDNFRTTCRRLTTYIQRQTYSYPDTHLRKDQTCSLVPLCSTAIVTLTQQTRPRVHTNQIRRLSNHADCNVTRFPEQRRPRAYKRVPSNSMRGRAWLL